jgi:hypothetical protein
MIDSFIDEVQIEEFIFEEDDYLSSVWDDDQELEAFSLECAFGPDEY